MRLVLAFSWLKRFLMGARAAALLLADAVFCRIPVVKTAGRREKVLVVRLDRIGDFLLWLPAARAFHDLYPADRYEMTLLAHPSWAALAREQDFFEHVWTLDVRRFVWDWPYRYRELSRIRHVGFGTLLQARCSRELLVEDAVTRASGAPERVGFDRETGAETRFQKPLSDRWYTRLVPAPSAGTMELERNARFLRALGLTDFRVSVPVLTTAGPPSALAEQQYYVLFPGAGWSGRQWPVERFAELAGLLYRQTGWTGVVCGGPGEAALSSALIRAASAPLQDWVGKTSVSEMAALFAGAELVVTNETSGVHMAAAVGTRSVCLLGGGHYGRFVPYQIEGPEREGLLPLPVIEAMPCFGCDWHCRYPVRSGDPVPCIANISVEKAWAAVRDQLARVEAQPEAASPNGALR